ncbi:MAG: hypothetical protein O2840_05120 [bacterium]|nr:hypothetical protein [bacterium]
MIDDLIKPFFIDTLVSDYRVFKQTIVVNGRSVPLVDFDIDDTKKELVRLQTLPRIIGTATCLASYASLLFDELEIRQETNELLYGLSFAATIPFFMYHSASQLKQYSTLGTDHSVDYASLYDMSIEKKMNEHRILMFLCCIVGGFNAVSIGEHASDADKYINGFRQQVAAIGFIIPPILMGFLHGARKMLLDKLKCIRWKMRFFIEYEDENADNGQK